MRRLLSGPADRGPGAPFRPDAAYEKHPQVAIRTESFGGLAYHYGNRRLVFLKSAALVDLVQALAGFPSAADAAAATVPAGQAAACLAALPRLLSSEIIRVRDPGTGPAR